MFDALGYAVVAQLVDPGVQPLDEGLVVNDARFFDVLLVAHVGLYPQHYCSISSSDGLPPLRCDVIRGSHLDLFDRCALAYRFTVHDRRVPDIKVPRWALIGWIMHKTFEMVVESGGEPKKVFIKNLHDYRSIVRTEWSSTYPDVPVADSEIPEVSSDDLMRAMDMLRHFVSFQKFIDKAISRRTEFLFEVCLDQEGTVSLRGKIDLILTVDDGLVIVDYKSSQPFWEHTEVPPQLLRYAIAVAVMEDVPVSKVETLLFNLQSGKVLRRRWTADEANAMIASIVRRVEHIRMVDPSTATGTIGSHCDTLCQYRYSCPVRRAIPRS